MNCHENHAATSDRRPGNHGRWMGIACILMLVIGGLALFMGRGRSIAPLLFLLCPLSHVLMMLFMGKTLGNHGQGEGELREDRKAGEPE